MKVKTRMAPSPTGNLHIGTARTALFNWLFTRHHGGEFIMRIEDTDIERSKKEFETDIIDGLKWLGLDWDNDQLIRQSERIDVYEEYLVKLMDAGKAFWCYHSKEDLEAEQKEQTANKEPLRHVCSHKKGEPGVKNDKGMIRLNVDSDSKRKIGFSDDIRGLIEFEEGLLGDISLAKDLRTPLYNFAVVVDDMTMEITHVIRGEDHISNTPKQLLIYEAFGVKPPIFAHLPLILGQDKSKLSKRHGATSVNDYKKDYLPEALVNFMGFLGFTYSKEILGKEEMAKEFDLEKVHKSGAVFDIKKLNWINAQYVRQLSISEFKKLTQVDVPDKAVALITERLEKLTDISDYSYLWQKPEYDSELLNWKNYSAADTAHSLGEVKTRLETLDTWDGDSLKNVLDTAAEKLSSAMGLPKTDRGLAYWPLRVALSGRDKSPDPISLSGVLSKEDVLERIKNALNKIQQ